VKGPLLSHCRHGVECPEQVHRENIRRFLVNGASILPNSRPNVNLAFSLSGQLNSGHGIKGQPEEGVFAWPKSRIRPFASWSLKHFIRVWIPVATGPLSER
jgi:hypothetical protein